MIKITLDDTLPKQQLDRIARTLKAPRKLYGVLGETLKKIHIQRFKQEVAPDGKEWQALDAATLAKKQRKGKSLKILRQDGYLSDKTAYNYTDQSVEFGSDAKYARLHQFGGKAGRKRQATIPKRPWLGVNNDDKEVLLNKATALLQKQLAQSIK